MLDGAEPKVIDEICRMTEHVPQVKDVRRCVRVGPVTVCMPGVDDRAGACERS